MVRLSHSSIEMFQRCKRWYFLAKIKKVPAVGDDRYMRRGSCFHDCAEWIIKNEDTSGLRDFFETTWNKYKLSIDFQKEHDATYLMVLEFLKNKPTVTSTEFEIYRSAPIHFVSYLDSINTEKNIIYDYKTSTFGYEIEPYKEQMKRYAMMYRYKFNRKPEKCVVWFVKYSPLRTIEYTFTDAELDACEAEIKDIDTFIEENTGKGEEFFGKADSCHVFCPYDNICHPKNETNFLIEIYGNKIKLIGAVDDIIHKALEKKFSYELKDAFFIKKRYPMADTRVRFWNSSNQTLPIGFLEGLKKTLSDYSQYYKKPLKLEISDCRKKNNMTVSMPDNFINGQKLRAYQEEAVNIFMEKKIGLLKLPTGSGKTECAIEIMRRLGVKTLFIVDRKELLEQTAERIKECLGVRVGKIGNSFSMIEDISVATIQTLSVNTKKYDDYLQSVRFVIFDESHKCAADTWQKIGSRLTGAEYRLLLTATAMRDDGNFMKVESVGGQTIYEVDREKLVDDGYLMHPSVIFIKNYMTADEAEKKRKNTTVGLISETAKYKIYYDEFVSRNDYRNNIVPMIIKRHSGKKILIVTRLVRHGQLMNLMIPGSRHIHGETAKYKREEIFKDFKDGKFNVLVSNIGIFSEGIDIPSLNIVINLSANRGSVKTVQLIGRIMRILEGKETPIYYDFIDGEKFFFNATNARKKILREQGYELQYIDAKDI